MKKILNVIKVVFTWIFVAFTLGMMIFTIFSVRTFDRNDRSVFGYKMFIVQSDSMKATDFAAGDLIFVQNVDDVRELKEGEIITFISRNSASFGETVTHKIRTVTKDPEGNTAFVTYGTTTDTNDEELVTAPYVVGRYTGHLPGVGTFFAFLKTTPGYICCILIPALILIGIQGWNVLKLLQQRKKEQLAELQAEREKVAEEREKTEQMLRELAELKAKLEQQAGNTHADETPQE